MNKVLAILVLFGILLSGCSEIKEQGTTDCCKEKEDLIKANTDIVTANAVLEDTRDYYKDKYETTRQIQLNDLTAMKKALDGFANCHIAVTCDIRKDYFYENLNCAELTELQLDEFRSSCTYSNYYNEFFEYVQEAELEAKT